MPNSTNSTIHKYPTPGRRMQVGRWCFDQERNSFGVFTGYCDNCHAKQIKDRDELTCLFQYTRKDDKAWLIRVLKHIMAVRKV